MTRIQRSLIRDIDEAYDQDCLLGQLVENPNTDVGDTLAKFVFLEILDVTQEAENLFDAATHGERAINRAISQLTAVRRRLAEVAERNR